MFLKENMTRGSKKFSYRIITSVTLVLNSITYEVIESRSRLNLCPFMWIKYNETSTAKNFERLLIWTCTIKMLIRGLILNSKRRNSIYGVDSYEGSFSTKGLKNISGD